MLESAPAAAPQSVNAVDWSVRLGHDQGQLRQGFLSILTIGGQRPVDEQGQLLHEGDAAAQAALALDNLTHVLVAAGLTVHDLAHLRIYATSGPALQDAQLVTREHLAAYGATTPVTAIQVEGLSLSGMEIEVDGLALLIEPQTEGTVT